MKKRSAVPFHLGQQKPRLRSPATNENASLAISVQIAKNLFLVDSFGSERNRI